MTANWDLNHLLGYLATWFGSKGIQNADSQ